MMSAMPNSLRIRSISTGGTVAAPVFSAVVQQSLRFMGVPPDMAVQPQIVADPVEESL